MLYNIMDLTEVNVPLFTIQRICKGGSQSIQRQLVIVRTIKNEQEAAVFCL